MKKILFSLFVLALFAACEDKNEGVASGELSGVKATGRHGEVAIEWVIPDTVNFLYVDISYVNSGNVNISKKVSRFSKAKDSFTVYDTIMGFADTKEYTFTLTPYSRDGIPATPVTVKATPLTPPFAEVLNSVKLLPDFGGAIVEWKNLTGRQVNIRISYLDNENQIVTKTFTTLSASKGSISSLSGDTKKYTYYAEDMSGNRSEKKETTIAIFAETKFDRTGWSVPGYNAGSQDATIGYSSQATNEGGAPQGRIIAIFDEDSNFSTFWHACWSPSSSYPHWFIIDMGTEVTISRIELRRRQGNGQGQKGQTFYTCTAAGASTPGNPVVWTWEDQGSYDFDITTNNAQSYRLANNPKARYIKVYFGTEYKGGGSYAMLSDMQVYGQE